VQAIDDLLICFELVSGLKVNLAKSILVPMGDVSNVGALVEVLGCGVATLPIPYLGLPLGSRFKDKVSWNGVVEKSICTLASWKRMYLSKGGRIALIKSTLSNLPTYLLAILPIPDAVATSIESIQCGFLWGGIGEEFKFHLVNWPKVCSPVREGGLGISNLRCFNCVLLGKWLWRYASESGAFWRKVVEAKYGSERGGGVLELELVHMGWVFGSLVVRNGIASLVILDLFWGMVPESASGGEVWCRSLPLREVFLGLYSLASNKEASIADNHELMIGSHQWNVSFLHSLNDWEVEDLASFYSLLYSYMLGGKADKIWWVPSRKKKFEVRSFYNIFISNVRLPFPWNSIWRTKALPGVAFFVWSIALGKILTLDSLRKKNMVFVNRCGMCKKDEESIDHLFLHCACAQFLWNAFFNRFGLAWVMPCGVVNLFVVLVVGGSLPKCRGLQNGSALYHVVSMVQTKWEIF
jgi:hypothetical protein